MFGVCAVMLAAVCTTALLSVQVAADYQLEVRLVSYSNPTHRRSNGDRCDRGKNIKIRPCDNIFTFELDVGNGCRRQQKSTDTYGNKYNDSITFGDTLEGGLDNPLVFTGSGPWPDNATLRIEVSDDDNNKKPQMVFKKEVTFPLRHEPTFLSVTDTKYRSTRTLQLSYQLVCTPFSGSYYTMSCNTTNVSMTTFGGEECTMAQETGSEEEDGGGGHVGLVIGGVMGGISVIVVLTTLTIVALRKSNRKPVKGSSDQVEVGFRCENPTYTSKGLPSKDSHRSSVKNYSVPEQASNTDTRVFQAAYSLCGPATPPVEVNGSRRDNQDRKGERREMCNEYDYIRLPAAARGYEVPIRTNTTRALLPYKCLTDST